MREIMERLLTMSIQAGVLILFVFLISQLTKKYVSPNLRYALWLLPAARLLMPFTFESPLSLMNLMAQSAAGPLTGDPFGQASLSPALTPAVQGSPVTQGTSATPPVSIPDAASQPSVSAAPDLMTVLFWVWVGGMALVLAYMLAVNIRFHFAVRKKRRRVECDFGLPVYCVAGLGSPCLYGYFSPAVLVNDAALRNDATLSLVLRHELCHHNAGDPWWALLRNAACIVHWFNPLVWWAALRSRSDCELACDARVMKGFRQSERERYGMALLAIIRTQRGENDLMNTATTMTGSKRELYERIEAIGKKGKRLRSAAAFVMLAAAIASLAACTSGMPAGSPDPNATQTPPAATATPNPDETRAPINTDETAAPDGSASEQALEAYKAVLLNNAEFFSIDNGRDLTLDDFLTGKEPYEVTFGTSRFTVLDMDGDGVPEVVLELTVNGNPQFYEILHYTDGAVYGYLVVYRGLEALKTDGTFYYSSGAADGGYAKMKFLPDAYEMDVLGYTESSQDDIGTTIAYFIDNQSVTEAEFNAFRQEKDSKEDVVWVEFTQANVETELSANQ